MTSGDGEVRPRVVRSTVAAASETAAVTFLAYLVVSRIFYAELGLDVVLDPGRLVLIAIVCGLIVLRRLATRLNPRLAIASWAVLAASGACLAIPPLLGIDVAGRIRTVLAPVKSGLFALLHGSPVAEGIYRLDDRYGFVHIPSSKYGYRGTTYTIDADGYRTMPDPAAPRGTAVFLGDSFTFGWGVDDDDAYPHVLAREHWTDLRIINAAVAGWGLTQFHLALTDLLAHPPYPDAVIVAVIDHDLRRSHLRPTLVPGQRRRLEWVDGGFISRPLTDAPITVRETPDLLEQEARLARETIDAMSTAARGRNVAFGVVLLGDDAFPPDVVYALGRSGIPTIDLTRLRPTMVPRILHPDAAGHRAIAAALAASPLRTLAYTHTADLDDRLNRVELSRSTDVTTLSVSPLEPPDTHGPALRHSTTGTTAAKRSAAPDAP